MQLRKSTFEKFADVLIRLGEASVIGGVATLVVKDFGLWQSLFALAGGIVLIIMGLFINNIAETKGV